MCYYPLSLPSKPSAFLYTYLDLTSFQSKQFNNREIYNINTNKVNILPTVTEDDFSILEDELSKTVGELKSTREQAIRSRKSLADNLTDISHQIKTPITSIALMSELLQNNIHDESLKDYLSNIDTNTWRIEKLVTSNLKFVSKFCKTPCMIFDNIPEDEIEPKFLAL